MPEFTLSKMDYDEYWNVRDESAEIQPRFPIMADVINDGSQVLDVGCGDGTFLEYLKKKKYVNEIGVDISQVAVSRARKKGVTAQVKKLDQISEEYDDGAFDYVVMSEVIEHVTNPEELVQTAWSLTSASLLVTIPNIGYWPHRLRLLFGRFPVQWVHHPGEHVRYWTIRDFSDWLDELILKEKVNTRLYPSNGITALNSHRIWPNLFCNQAVIEIRKQ